ncbi:MAG: hypothetical protein EOP10_17830 [Proteobacteria bacterium]|nr:MAG: hypothetical protein EOP10_17830 [Pseudomonadota bacterium]
MKISTALLALTLAASLNACGKSSKKSAAHVPTPKAEVTSLEAAPKSELTEAKPAEEAKVEETKVEDVVIVVREISPEEVVLTAAPSEAEVKKDEVAETPSARQEEILVIKDTCTENEDGDGSLAMVQQKEQIAQASFLDNDCKVPSKETAHQATQQAAR